MQRSKHIGYQEAQKYTLKNTHFSLKLFDMESTNLTLKELEFIIFAMSKTPTEKRSNDFKKVYSKILLIILEKLEKQQKTTL